MTRMVDGDNNPGLTLTLPAAVCVVDRPLDLAEFSKAEVLLRAKIATVPAEICTTLNFSSR